MRLCVRSSPIARGIAADAQEFDTEFNRYKQLGFLPADKDKATEPDAEACRRSEARGGRARRLLPQQSAPAPTRRALEVTFHPDYSVFDGRFAMNPWLQELPDPITKLVWDNAALVSPSTAVEFGLKTGRLWSSSRRMASNIEIPVYVLPGQADCSIALPYGQFGEMRIKHVPDGGGTNVYPLRKSNGMHTVAGLQAREDRPPRGPRGDAGTRRHSRGPRDRSGDVAEEHRKKKANDLFKHVTGKTHIEIIGGKDNEKHGPPIGLPPDGHLTEDDLKKGYQGGYGNKQQPPAPVREKQKRFPLDLARPELLDSQFQWGMVIDLSACTGCSACIIACQAENNIPVVGKHEVKRNREMHWIRVDRYFSSDGHTAHEDPTIVTQPLACVHCEQAPCEAVAR